MSLNRSSSWNLNRPKHRSVKRPTRGVFIVVFSSIIASLKRPAASAGGGPPLGGDRQLVVVTSVELIFTTRYRFGRNFVWVAPRNVLVSLTIALGDLPFRKVFKTNLIENHSNKSHMSRNIIAGLTYRWTSNFRQVDGSVYDSLEFGIGLKPAVFPERC